MAARGQKRQSKAQKCIEAHTELIAILDTLAALPPEACRCGSTVSHERCTKCGTCAATPCPWAHTRYGFSCGECGAKPSYYMSPVRTWFPKDRFAATFARDLAAKVRRGIVPSPKQVALAEKLAREDHNRKPYAWERPAISWVTPRGKKAWTACVALVERDAFGLTEGTKSCIDSHRAEPEDCGRDVQAAAKETIALVRATTAHLIEERTGYAVLSSVDDYADALKAASGDKLLEAALYALLDIHEWLVREKRVIDACPPRFAELRKAISFGDREAVVVLADALMEVAA